MAVGPDGNGYITLNINTNSSVNTAPPLRSPELEKIIPASTVDAPPAAQSLSDTVDSINAAAGGTAEAKKPGYFPWMTGAAREVGRRGKATWNYVSDAIGKHPRTALGFILGDLGLETQGWGLGSLINRNTPEFLRPWHGYGPAPDPRLVRDPGSRDIAAGGGPALGMDTKTAPERAVSGTPTYMGQKIHILGDGTAWVEGTDGDFYQVNNKDITWIP